jgi:hypothetical protein
MYPPRGRAPISALSPSCLVPRWYRPMEPHGSHGSGAMQSQMETHTREDVRGSVCVHCSVDVGGVGAVQFRLQTGTSLPSFGGTSSSKRRLWTLPLLGSGCTPVPKCAPGPAVATRVPRSPPGTRSNAVTAWQCCSGSGLAELECYLYSAHFPPRRAVGAGMGVAGRCNEPGCCHLCRSPLSAGAFWVGGEPAEQGKVVHPTGRWPGFGGRCSRSGSDRLREHFSARWHVVVVLAPVNQV